MTLSLKNREPVAIIACKILQSALEEMLPERLRRRIQFMDYGLHRAPTRLNQMLQAAIDAIEIPGRIVVGYGLCGNGLCGIKAGQHTLIIPKVDDCIALLLGSRRAYQREMQRAPGTYYLNKGWLESGSHPLKEYREYTEKYGAEDAAWIMDQQYRNYERLVLIAHNQNELNTYRPQALEVARYCRQWGMRYEEILASDRYIRRLAEIIEDPDKIDDEFVIVPPGGINRQELFWEYAVSASEKSKKEMGSCE
ncbi:MAG: DUF1638 domain-containing protein [Desulfobacterales bacterium]|jgi:hypothetical protein